MKFSLGQSADGQAFRLGSLGTGGPEARLSALAAGDMEYRPGVGNPARDAWLAGQGFDPAKALAVRLIHSRRVLKAGSPAELAGEEADGIVTDNQRACAVVTVADCMPIFLYDPDSGAYGALHSGWKGTGILADAVSLMERTWGSKPSRLSVVLGPCVGGCCYPVDEERARVFANAWGSASVMRDGGQPRLDLREANRALAESLGIVNLRWSEDCTSCRPDMGSYRRQGAATFSRMAAAIGYPRP